MADGKPLTSTELAGRTALAGRYLREWLHAQAAGGRVSYDPGTTTFIPTAEHAALAADPDAPTFLLGGFDWIPSFRAGADTLQEASRSGPGNVTSETATSAGFPGQHDLACLSDCLHDMGDPAGALRHIRQSPTEGRADRPSSSWGDP
jgi:hypothetical protein